MRGANAQDYVDLKKKAGFYVEESGYPRIVKIWGKYHGAHSRTNLVDENGLECFGLVRLPDCGNSLGEKRVTKADGEDGEGILGRARKWWWVWRRGRYWLGGWGNIKTGHEHYWCELHHQFWRIRIHIAVAVVVQLDEARWRNLKQHPHL